jgi:hypothetical protein
MAKKTLKIKPAKRKPKEDFNQAAFRAVQQTIQNGRPVSSKADK